MHNKANQQLDTRLIKTIARHESELRALKTRQLVGGDNLVLSATGQTEFIQSLAPGAFHSYTISYFAETRALYQATMRVSNYINFDTNPAYLWPVGSSLVPNFLFPFRRTVTEDSILSDETGSGAKTFVVTIENLTNSTANPVTYTVYTYAEVIYPNQVLLP